MTYNVVKLGVAGVLALACIVALILDAATNSKWAIPVLSVLVGYVVGNAQVTAREGATAPIVSTRPDN